MLTVIIECGACAGSGQWPNRDGSVIQDCPLCEGQASWNLTLTGRLEREVRWLVVQQQQARQRPA